MDRQKLIERLLSYDDTNVPEIGDALELLESSVEIFVSNDDLGDIYERVSKAIDRKYSDDENHDAWKLEIELSSAYKR